MENDNGVPLYRVGLTYNLKHSSQADKTEDDQAEYDCPDTIEALKTALSETGCEVIPLEAEKDVFNKLVETRPDIVFNIAEGRGGRGREAQIPALLNFLSIPFTGSDETTLCIALDKGLTKKILTLHKIKTPKYQVYAGDRRPLVNLGFPVIVKPNAEGSSKGIIGTKIARDKNELKKILEKKWEQYRQPLLIEEFIDGKEFTVGILGNGTQATIFRPMEIKISPVGNKDGSRIYSYEVKTNYQEYVSYHCPADIPEDVERKMMKTAGRIYDILECKDFARIDFMLDNKGTLNFIEINPLPGLAPGYSDYPMLASFNGVTYNELIKRILNSGLQRHGLMPAAWG